MAYEVNYDDNDKVDYNRGYYRIVIMIRLYGT